MSGQRRPQSVGMMQIHSFTLGELNILLSLIMLG